MVFCNEDKEIKTYDLLKVTILILVDGFLQYKELLIKFLNYKSHNPYFSRWFSAIIKINKYTERRDKVTILILVDGFLQYVDEFVTNNKVMSQSLF